MREGKIIVIVAPSGTGKSTLMSYIRQEFPAMEESISTTTRGMRKGEIDGTHYFFKNASAFEKLISQNEFLEWAKVHSNYYGTSKEFVDSKVACGVDLIFDLDVQGADSFKKYFKEKAHVIFIEPPSVEILRERLLCRATDTEKVIDERISNAKKELQRKNDYDYCVMNDQLEEAQVKLKEIISKILGKGH